MDPTKAAEQLATGNERVILAAALVFMTLVAVFLGKALIDSFKDRNKSDRETLKQSSDETRLVTDALKDMKSMIELALAALKGRP